MSDCRRYRYRLERWWDRSKPAAGFVLCNPSTADAFKPDPTVRKCIGFAHRWRCGGIVIVNVCAFRATHPRDLLAAADPLGPDNREAIGQFVSDWHHYHAHKDRDAELAADGVSVIVAGWGSALPRQLEGEAETTLGWLDAEGVDVHCLGQTKSGRPRHPLMLAYETPLEVLIRKEDACAG